MPRKSDKVMKILVVDDEIDALELLKEYLEEKNFIVVSSSDPIKALKIIETESIDLVIADLKMPKMDGIELTKEIKYMNQEMPVIIMTAYASIESAVESIKAGASDFITKPFRFNHTLFVINKALETKRLSLLAKKSDYYKKLSRIDELTKLYNFRSFKKVLSQQLKEHKEMGKELSLMMADIDDFKNVNDSYGHQSGDRVLKDISAIFRKSVRGCDFLARYGGEEFAVILPETDSKAALKVGERILKEISGFQFKSRDEKYIGKLTVTVGLSTFPVDGKSVDKLLETADKALYKGKESGKNTICTINKCY
ncbi:MAG: diguanylate cyclase [Acidobacteriota bacterium]